MYHGWVRRTDFAYDLPPELIAQAPLPERSASRMLVLNRATGAPADRLVRELPQLLAPGDLLVLNDTRVVAARLIGAKPTGGRVEILLERAVCEREALAQISASKPVREGLMIVTPGGMVQVLGREGELWRIGLPAPALDFFDRWGQVPLPPYIHRAAEESDRRRYQSLFARERGAVAAPTASLHFDASLLQRIRAQGVDTAFVTLHVGAGTFQPVRVDDLDAHVMHAEQVTVGAVTCEAIAKAKAAGRRVVAVGTTVVRALESAALNAEPAAGVGDGAPHPLRLAPWSGETRLFIRPGFQFRVVDALLTNFHLPESTLLMLVCAFAGRESVLRAYRHAVEAGYRFFSYGDAMFLAGGIAHNPGPDKED
jgi:S-adenosylmethionine:tRNA ribosyltransferase-isomerase